ncbi:hypothetical protein ACO2Q9_17130 [Variovorax sp. VNK109]|jgi:hypothetical protein|uniref:hypothetical protein n=1 Tax=Variovorax sp. VNK109 TaxID=3400919 RepID=UPI003BFE7FF2
MRLQSHVLPSLLTAALLAAASLAQAQVPPPPDLAREPVPADRSNQKIERIVVEDAGSRVDEVRVGGQTQSITVQPKTNVPGYEVKPADGVRAPLPVREGASGGGGTRVWSIGKF